MCAPCSDNTTQLAKVMLSTGTIVLIGKPFPSTPWTIGGNVAITSTYDDCNVVFSQMMYTIDGNDVVVQIIGNDMQTGALTFNVTNPYIYSYYMAYAGQSLRVF